MSQQISPSQELTVVIPAYNAAGHLAFSLPALLSGSVLPVAIIVVDDGSSDNTLETARRFGCRVLQTGGRRGPAFARNLGARAAETELILFLDADVCVQNTTVQRIVFSFASDSGLDALIGSYDTEPQAPDFLSQYRNLMHAFVHQSGARIASTFWSGCGAIRRAVFLRHSGFDESFRRPAIEDIELGYRMVNAGNRIHLDHSIQVRHLKRWTFWNLVKTDVLDRGIPWTELILRSGVMPNDLNLELSQRVSVALVFLLIGLAMVMTLTAGHYFLLPLFVIVFTLLARWWSEFGSGGRPGLVTVILFAAIAVIGVMAWREKMPGLLPPLLFSPALLLVQHRYNQRGSKPVWLRWMGLACAAGSILLALRYLPSHGLLIPVVLVLVLLGLLNSQFYIFLAAKRGIPFMLAAIPFHLLFHFYNGVSFGVGVVLHLWTRQPSAASGTERDG